MESERREQIIKAVLDTAFRIHTTPGPGLLESLYETILSTELRKQGLRVENQKTVEFEYNGTPYRNELRLDLLVEDEVIVELKSVEKLPPVASKQLLTYLRLCDKKIGLLINFGESSLRNGVHRILNSHCQSD
jgi:iron complex transport system substrate-binding protein